MHAYMHAHACTHAPHARTRHAQVRDFSFSPDTGAISRIIYDDFGLGFLPVRARAIARSHPACCGLARPGMCRARTLAQRTHACAPRRALQVAFFDTYSVPMSDTLSVGPAGITVLDEAKYRERRESAGVFTAIPSLLRCGPALARAPVRVAGVLPSHCWPGFARPTLHAR